MEIRVLTSDDAENYWKLRLEALQQNPEAFATTYEDAITRKDPVTRVANNLESPSSTTIGAYVEEDLVGVMTLSNEDIKKLQHRVNLFAVYVTPRMRGKNIGAALLKEVIQTAKQLPGVEKMNLSVVTSNTAAIYLYEKFGFTTFGVEKKAMKVGEEYFDELHMSMEW
ncbi:MAG: N-acetyltransferase family protein [Paenisporosarcina sp.]